MKVKLRALFVLVMLCCTSLSSASALDKVAYIYGINDFASRINPLRYAEDDARAFYQYMKSNYAKQFSDNIYLRTNYRASKSRVLADLADLANTRREIDLLILYFSTHGAPPDKNGNPYIILYDTVIDPTTRIHDTGLGREELLNALSNIKAKNIFIVLDVNYGGGKWPRLLEYSKGRQIVILASCSERQKVWESDIYGNSYFIYNLMQGLENSPQGSFRDAFLFAQKEVPKQVREQKNAEQTPTVESTSPDWDYRLTKEQTKLSRKQRRRKPQPPTIETAPPGMEYQYKEEDPGWKNLKWGMYLDDIRRLYVNEATGKRCPNSMILRSPDSYSVIYQSVKGERALLDSFTKGLKEVFCGDFKELGIYLWNGRFMGKKVAIVDFDKKEIQDAVIKKLKETYPNGQIFYRTYEGVKYPIYEYESKTIRVFNTMDSIFFYDPK